MKYLEIYYQNILMDVYGYHCINYYPKLLDSLFICNNMTYYLSDKFRDHNILDDYLENVLPGNVT